MRLLVVWIGVVSVRRGVASTEAEFPIGRGSAEGSAVGGSSEAELVHRPRAGLLPSGKTEMKHTVGGIGKEASSEAEVAPSIPKGPRMARTMLSGRVGHVLGFFLESEEDLDVE